jgi:uncharacterized RmlC-like cupin family protein
VVEHIPNDGRAALVLDRLIVPDEEAQRAREQTAQQHQRVRQQQIHGGRMMHQTRYKQKMMIAGTGQLRVISATERVPELASGAMLRESAIAQQTVGAQMIWVGYAELPPGCISAVHHHGEAESGIYIISGHARFYTGEQLDEPREAHAGDFVWVPPDLVHVEMNASQTEPVRMVVARSTQAALTFNLPTPEGWKPA